MTMREQAESIDPEIGSDPLLPRGLLPPPRLGLTYRLDLQTRLRRALRSIYRSLTDRRRLPPPPRLLILVGGFGVSLQV